MSHRHGIFGDRHGIHLQPKSSAGTEKHEPWSSSSWGIYPQAILKMVSHDKSF